MADVDEHVHRILRTLFAYGALDRAGYRNDDAQIDKPGHAKASGELEAQAITLLRNNGTLPLDTGRVKTIAIIGSDADSFKRGGGSSAIDPFSFTTPRQAITQRAGPGVQVLYDDGSDNAKAAAVARLADVALAFASDQASEGHAKACLSLSCNAAPGRSKDDLIEAVAATNRRTTVVLETAGCTSRRSVRIKLKRVRRGRVRTVTVFVGGKRRRVFHGRRRHVNVKLAGLPKGRYRVRIVTRTTRGKRLVQTRSYRTCTKNRQAKPRR